MDAEKSTREVVRDEMQQMVAMPVVDKTPEVHLYSENPLRTI